MPGSDDTQPERLTQLLLRWSEGDRESLNELVPAVEGELRRMAQRQMRRERPGHTLQATALVNEAYLKLVQQDNVKWKNRAHFFGIAARIMRQILVDHARGVRREKRGGDAIFVPLEDAVLLAPDRPAEILELDQAMDRLAAVDSRLARVVELRYFGGLSVEESAEVLEVHPNTVIHDWSFAKAWLKREVGSPARAT